MFLKCFFFEDVLLLSISKDSFEIPSSDDIFLGNFSYSNSMISVEDLRKWNRDFDIFLIDRYDSEIGNKNVTGKYYKILVTLSPTLY